MRRALAALLEPYDVRTAATVAKARRALAQRPDLRSRSSRRGGERPAAVLDEPAELVGLSEEARDGRTALQ
jgi:hypothetical protein